MSASRSSTTTGAPPSDDRPRTMAPPASMPIDSSIANGRTSATVSTIRPTSRSRRRTSRMEPVRTGALAGSSLAPRSITVTIVPRTLIRPRTYAAAPGRRVASRSGRISRASRTSQPYSVVPTRNSSVGSVSNSGVDSVEAKELERVGVGERDIGTGSRDERVVQLLRQRRSQIDQLPVSRVAEDQPGRVQEVAARWKSHQLARAAAAVRVVAHDRMSDRGEMHANLVRTSGEQVRTKQI